MDANHLTNIDYGTVTPNLLVELFNYAWQAFGTLILFIVLVNVFIVHTKKLTFNSTEDKIYYIFSIFTGLLNYCIMVYNAMGIFINRFTNSIHRDYDARKTLGSTQSRRERGLAVINAIRSVYVNPKLMKELGDNSYISLSEYVFIFRDYVRVSTINGGTTDIKREVVADLLGASTDIEQLQMVALLFRLEELNIHAVIKRLGGVE